jgi:hypothetical protein
MAKPQPTDDAVEYEATVTVTFRFPVFADDDVMADELAAYEWEDNTWHGEIDRIRVEMVEEEEDDSDDAIGGDEDE